jgi:putative oxidoreductase
LEAPDRGQSTCSELRLEDSMKLGRLLARGVVGGLFVGHGTQKLYGWFDGPGLDGATKMMESLGLRPGRRNALAASISETAGGAMLAAGFLTPLAAASLIGTMITAIRTVHFKNGLWNSGGGYEFNLALIAATLAIVDGGPGPFSLDAALGIHDTGSKWAVAALAAGAVGSTLVIETGRRHPSSDQPVSAGPDVPADAAAEQAVAVS